MTTNPRDPDIAVVGYCPICGQGRQMVVQANLTKKLFVYCEECESEWESPSDIRRIDLATHDKYGSLTFMLVNDLRDHPWFPNVINKG